VVQAEVDVVIHIIRHLIAPFGIVAADISVTMVTA
jgi:hypothetical protein